MSLGTVPFAVLVAYFRLHVHIGPVINNFAGKRNFLVWKGNKVGFRAPLVLE